MRTNVTCCWRGKYIWYWRKWRGLTTVQWLSKTKDKTCLTGWNTLICHKDLSDGSWSYLTKLFWNCELIIFFLRYASRRWLENILNSIHIAPATTTEILSRHFTEPRALSPCRARTTATGAREHSLWTRRKLEQNLKLAKWVVEQLRGRTVSPGYYYKGKQNIRAEKYINDGFCLYYG